MTIEGASSNRPGAGDGGAGEATRSLRLLLVEDSEADALFIVRELEKAGYRPIAQRVQTADTLAAALREPWHLITCDWKMPGFDAPAALEVIARAGVDVPVLIVSGEVGEEFAVTAMRRGAYDFVSKSRLARLAPSVERALREAEDRRARARAEDALRTAERRYQALIERTSDQVAVVDVDGTYRYVSPSHLGVLGYRPEELVGTNAFALVHPDDIERLRQQTAARGGSFGGVAEMRIRHNDGSWRTLEITVQDHRDDPLIGGLLINGRDVTARVEMEEQLRRQQAALRQEREFLETLIHSLPEPIWMKDPQGVYLTCNPAFARFVGRPIAAIAGRTDDELFGDPALGDFFRAKDAEAIGRGGPYRYEERVTSAAGTAVLLETTKTPIHGAGGEILGVLGVSRDITAARQVEESLRTQVALQSQLERIAETTPGAIVSFCTGSDGTTSCPYASPGLRELTGLDQEVLRHDISPLLALIHPDDVGHVGDSISHAALTLTPWRDTYRIRHPTRGEVWIDAHFSPQREADGSILWHGVLLDISERKAAEGALRESEQRYRSLFQNMLDGYAYCRMLYRDGEAVDFVYLEVNPAFETLTGLRDVIGRKVSELIPGLLETNLEILRIYEQVVATGVPRTFEGQLQTLGIWLKISVYPAGPQEFIAVFDNVTESKRAQALTTLQATALEASANAIVITDQSGAIVWANPAFTRLTGYQLEEAVGQNPRFLKSGVQDDPFYARLWQTITGGQVWSGKVVNRRKDGSQYTEEMTITPVRSEGGEITHFIAVKQDISERQRAEREIQRLASELEQRVARRTAELEAANRDLEAFTYTVSHDLRAPLRSIEGFSRAVLEDYGAALPAEGRHYLEVLHESAERMNRLLEALLNLSRLGRQPLATSRLEPEPMLRTVLAELQPQLAGRRVELRIGALPPCEADPTLLRQVWLNLLSNALKYTSKRSEAHIEVGSLRRDGEVVYYVRDDGAGFDMSRAQRLFGVFQRLHSPSEFEGTGAGLAIAQRIVERHGGRVWAEAAVDQGATFYFTLGPDRA